MSEEIARKVHQAGSLLRVNAGQLVANTQAQQVWTLGNSLMNQATSLVKADGPELVTFLRKANDRANSLLGGTANKALSQALDILTQALELAQAGQQVKLAQAASETSHTPGPGSTSTEPETPAVTPSPLLIAAARAALIDPGLSQELRHGQAAMERGDQDLAQEILARAAQTLRELAHKGSAEDRARIAQALDQARSRVISKADRTVGQGPSQHL